MEVKNHEEPIRVVCASNNHYVVLLAGLIKSIEKNNVNGRRVNVYIIEDRIKQKNKDKLEHSFKDPSIKLIWIPLDKNLFSNIIFPKDYSTYPKNIYSRLIIDQVLPSYISKVIYLDSDMMFNTDISQLWDLDLDGNVIGAVQEPNVKYMDCPWSGVKNYQELNIPAKAKYFNSGLLIIDLDQWRQQNITQKVVDCVDKNKTFAGHQPDQYGLNAVLWNKWKELEPGWNHYSNIDSVTLPYNIHFVIKKPIFTNYDGLVRYKDLFYDYLDETQWKNFKPIGEFKRKLIKINNILEKVF